MNNFKNYILEGRRDAARDQYKAHKKQIWLHVVKVIMLVGNTANNGHIKSIHTWLSSIHRRNKGNQFNFKIKSLLKCTDTVIDTYIATVNTYVERNVRTSTQVKAEISKILNEFTEILNRKTMLTSTEFNAYLSKYIIND